MTYSITYVEIRFADKIIANSKYLPDWLKNYVEIRNADEIIYSSKYLPDWLTFDESTRRFLGVPGKEHLGEYTI